MKTVLFLIMITLAACTSSRYMPDKQEQGILIRAYKETKQNHCGLPHKQGMGRTWHVDIVTTKGDTIPHHYFTESLAVQKWLVPGDKYTLRYSTEDSLKNCGKTAWIYTDLKRNH